MILQGEEVCWFQQRLNSYAFAVVDFILVSCSVLMFAVALPEFVFFFHFFPLIKGVFWVVFPHSNQGYKERRCRTLQTVKSSEAL